MPRREIEKNLSRLLVETELNFLPTREISLDEIYSNIELIYPDLCDDNFLCVDCCLGGSNDPEWRHIVRGVLSSLKTKGVFENTRRGHWKKN